MIRVLRWPLQIDRDFELRYDAGFLKGGQHSRFDFFDALQEFDLIQIKTTDVAIKNSPQCPF